MPPLARSLALLALVACSDDHATLHPQPPPTFDAGSDAKPVAVYPYVGTSIVDDPPTQDPWFITNGSWLVFEGLTGEFDGQVTVEFEAVYAVPVDGSAKPITLARIPADVVDAIAFRGNDVVWLANAHDGIVSDDALIAISGSQLVRHDLAAETSSVIDNWPRGNGEPIFAVSGDSIYTVHGNRPTTIRRWQPVPGIMLETGAAIAGDVSINALVMHGTTAIVIAAESGASSTCDVLAVDTATPGAPVRSLVTAVACAAPAAHDDDKLYFIGPNADTIDSYSMTDGSKATLAIPFPRGTELSAIGEDASYVYWAERVGLPDSELGGDGQRGVRFARFPK